MDAAPGSFLDGLSEEALLWLHTHAFPRCIQKGAALFHERQVPDAVYVLLSGRAKLCVNTAEGREVILEVRGPGDLLGEQGAIEDQPRSASAFAVDPVEVLELPTADFLRFLQESPDASLSIMRILSRRLREATARRVEFAAHDALGRVASRLAELADRYGKPVGDAIVIDLAITQEELASWTGSSREAVARALLTLRNAGWIETGRRTISVLDVEALGRLGAA